MQFQHNGYKVSLEMGVVQMAQPIIGSNIAAPREDEQPVTISITLPDGNSVSVVERLYVGCHGENPDIEVKDIEAWTWGSDNRPNDYKEGIEIRFPDGSLYVYPNGDTLWED